MQSFGHFIRTRREHLRETDPAYSIRRVAKRMGIQPSYLSKVERGEVAPPSEETTRKLAHEIDVDSVTCPQMWYHFPLGTPPDSTQSGYQQ
jgi:transcriptional regulator with XRE-family HTH domain